MRALVITEFPPMGKTFEARGNYRRFSIFMSAICEIADRVDILHLWPSEDANLSQLDIEQSDRFGLSVSTHVVGARLDPHGRLNDYLLGVFSASHQDPFFRYSGTVHAEKVLQLLDQRPEVVFVHRLSAMMPVIRSGARPARMFFDLDDIEHNRRIQTALEQKSLLRKIAQLGRAPPVLFAEQKAASLSSATFICSEHDRKHLARLGVARPTIIQNAVALPPTVAPLSPTPTILFLGYCYYKANADAAERLVQKIFPRIKAQMPSAELIIAGSGTEKLASARSAIEGVRYVGYVDDLADLYASTRVVCCPVTFGTGTRMKLIEAGAYGRPMVATQLAAEGLNFRDGSEIFLAEDDDAIATNCLRLLSDDELARRSGMAARSVVEKTYDERAVKQRILDYFKNGPASA